MKAIILTIILLSPLSCSHNNEHNDLVKLFNATCIDGYYQTSNFNGMDCWYEKVQDENNQFIKCGVRE